MKDTFISFHLPNFLFSWLKRGFFFSLLLLFFSFSFVAGFFIFMFNGIETWACTLLFVYTYLSHRCLWKRRKRRRAGGRLRKFPSNNVAATWQQHDSRSQPHRVYVSSFLLAQLISPPPLSQPVYLNPFTCISMWHQTPIRDKENSVCFALSVHSLAKLKTPTPPNLCCLVCIISMQSESMHPNPSAPCWRPQKKRKRKRK